MYNQAAFRQQQGIDDAMKKGVKDEELAGDYAYEGGWQIGLSRLPIKEMLILIDEHGIEKVIAAYTILVEGD